MAGMTRRRHNSLRQGYRSSSRNPVVSAARKTHPSEQVVQTAHDVVAAFNKAMIMLSKVAQNNSAVSQPNLNNTTTDLPRPTFFGK